MNKKMDIARAILDHPDKEEIIAKLAIGISCDDIHEWLKCKYETVDEQKFSLSEKTLSTFYKDYFDFYQIIKSDATQITTQSSAQQMDATLATNTTYQKALEKYVNSEVDIRLIVKRLVASIEVRAEQLFDMIQADDRNTKMDEGFVKMMNLLLSACEKFESIQNGTSGTSVNVQNNINIQVVDKHLAVVCNLITEILAKIDLNASLLFLDRFSEEMKKLSTDNQIILPIDVRLSEAKSMNTIISAKLDK